MRKSVLLIGFVLVGLFFSTVEGQAQCPNLNFSMGDFTNWQAYSGTCDNGIHINPSPVISGRHSIMDAQQLLPHNQLYDERCPTIRKVPAGFNYSVKLGNENAGAEMEALEYMMTVDSTNSLLIVHFAWVMGGASHAPSQQPSFSITIKDSNGIPLSNLFPCNNVIEGEGLVCKTSTFLARNWVSANYDLELFIGQTIKVYIETRDCALGEHAGYAYIVAECKHRSMVRPAFSLPDNNKSWCNKTEIPFTVIMPVANDDEILLKLEYDWGDGDTTLLYETSKQKIVTTHFYDLPLLENKVYVRLKVSIRNAMTYEPIGLGCEKEFIDSLIIKRPVAAFTDDGHEFPCPERMNGEKGRTISFTNQSQGELYQLMWHFEDIDSGSSNIVTGLASDYDVSNPEYTYNQAGIYDVLLIVQDRNNCIDSIWKKKHVVILGPRGSVSNTEDDSNCKPSQVTFFPMVELDQTFQPDSIAIYVGTGEVLLNKGDYFGLTRSRRHVYQNAGAYLPVYFLYKTVEFLGRKETCIVAIRSEDTIYIIDLEPNFETASLYCTETPVTFNNTSSWMPNYLQGNDAVTMSWNMGNGDSSLNYNGETQYNTAGIYTVTLTAQVLKCVREKTTEIQVMEKDDCETYIISNKINNNTSVIIYPNPTSGKLKIENEGSIIENVDIFDVMGRNVYSSTCPLVYSSTISIDIFYLPAGVYIMQIKTENGISTQKIVKE
jgi:PKD repeat protein